MSSKFSSVTSRFPTISVSSRFMTPVTSISREEGCKVGGKLGSSMAMSVTVEDWREGGRMEDGRKVGGKVGSLGQTDS